MVEPPPYNSLSRHWRERFGGPVYRLALDGAFTCPNLDGTRGRGGCFFCDASGSLAGYAQPGLAIRDQIARAIAHLAPRTGAAKFIAYFQSFTATHAAPERLLSLCEEALGADPRVVGLAIGARADCLSDAMLDMLGALQTRTHLWLDAGLESANGATLARINRQSTVGEFEDSMRRAKARGLAVCAHVIFGLPGDSEEDMLRSVEIIDELGLDGLKIHNLYIDSDSVFAALWRGGKIPMIARETYIDLVCRALARLRPEVVIHRLTGEAPRGRHLAPDWALDKAALIEALRAEMRRRGLRQGSGRQLAGRPMPGDAGRGGEIRSH